MSLNRQATVRYRHQSLFVLAFLIAAIPTPTGASQLLYYGGPVLSNTEVVMVNWSSNVPIDVKTVMPGYYSDIVQSDYWTILRQYATTITAQDGMPGSNQQIDFGSFAGSFTITPVQCPGTSNCTVTDTQIATELTAQIDAQNLPAPTLDAAGNVNTLYMVHFAPGVSITTNGGARRSCVQFCSTSMNFSYGGNTVAAVIVPDQGGACAAGCGVGTHLVNHMHVASYELADLATCPLAASAVTVDRPVAWYDNVGTGGGLRGRIADRCNGQIDTVTINGLTYTVSRLWSNQQAACISSNNMFVVKPSAGTNGEIEPATLQAVDSGMTTLFTVTPSAGFSAAVGGTCGGNLVGAQYTTNAITTDCTVVATFSDRIFANGFD